jgi:hypothetical protein
LLAAPGWAIKCDLSKAHNSDANKEGTMRAKILGRLVGLIGLAMAVMLGLSGKALATTTTSEFSFPFSVTACNGDTVIGTAVVHLVESSTTDSNGGTHIDFKASEHGTGTGSPSGADYVLNV